MKVIYTRVHNHQDAYVKAEVKRSKGTTSEGELYRELIDRGIKNRKEEKSL